MLTTRKVVESPHFTILSVACEADHAHWSAPEASTTTQIVLVRQGRFRIEAHGRRVTADPTTGYLHRPGEEVRFAHPAGGDICTSITLKKHDLLPPSLEATPNSPAVQIDARLELAHHLLLRSTQDPDFTAAEQVLHLLTLATRRHPDDRPVPGRPELADRAREAIVADDPNSASLVKLARLLDTSPSHLSRTFRHHVGMPVSQYRNRTRISRALTRLNQGETDLATLAADLGFSDQAHLTRVMRTHLGRTPAHIRALMAESPARLAD